MSTRSGRIRTSIIDTSPVRTRKGVSPPRSPARTRKSSPPAGKSSSPARPMRKSPSRKSPNRQPPSKFPAPKSPSRTTKTTKQTAEVAPQVIQKSPSKRPSIKSDAAVNLEDMSTKFEIFRSTRSKRIDYSVTDITPTRSETPLDKINGLESISNDIYGLRNRRSVDEVTPRRSSRLREYIDKFDSIEHNRQSVSKSISQSKSISKSNDSLSDKENSEDEFRKETSMSVARKLATPMRSSISTLSQISSKWEFGGRIGSAALILLIPLTVFSIIISCIKTCSLNIDLTLYKSLQVWFSLQSFTFVIAQLFIQAFFALIPIFGTKCDRMDETGTKYCFNAFFSNIFTVNTIFLLDFMQIINKNVLLNKYLPLATVSYIFGVILSTALYMKSRKLSDRELNSYGNTGYVLYDFFMGREIHPYIKTLDIKIWVSRISNINALILSLHIFSKGINLQMNENETFILQNYKEILNQVQLKPTILVFSVMQITYVLHFIVREYKITSTFYWQSEGMGYMQIVSSSLYPYYFTTISKNVADSELSLSTNALISASVLFALGFFVMLISNNIKHEFRTNPLHPSLTNLDSMPTFHGKKLLLSSFWGIVRHPNYAGDILVHVALALSGILSRQYTASFPALLTIIALLHRSWRDHGRCRRRYGAAWQRYCNRVPSVVIPKLL